MSAASAARRSPLRSASSTSPSGDLVFSGESNHAPGHLPCMTIRQPSKVVTAHRQLEGAGFVVRRPLPTEELEMVDPFLLIDEMGPGEYGPGEALGAPDHPHRGFQTVTHALAGAFQHEGSSGDRGALR